MKTLWTPWRMDHVSGTAPRVSSCLFESPRTEAADNAHPLLFGNNLTVEILNRFPYGYGHLLSASCRQGLNIVLNLEITAGAGISAPQLPYCSPIGKRDHNFITFCAETCPPKHTKQTFDLFVPDFLKLPTPPTP